MSSIPSGPTLPQLNSYITRVQYISQVGTNVAAVALYRNDLSTALTDVPPSPKLNQAIMDAGYNYDHINADSLLHCTVREQMLVTTGGAHYRAFVLPPLDAIGAAVAEKLQGFAAAGLPDSLCRPGPIANRQPLRRTPTQRKACRLRCATFTTTATSASAPAPAMQSRNSVAWRIRISGSTAKPLSFIQKQIGRLTMYFLRNDSDASQHLNAEFEAEGMPELWDPWTGEIASIAASRRNGNWVKLELDLQPLASALIVFDPDSSAASAPAIQPIRKLKRAEPIGTGGWRLTATGLVPTGKTATIQS